MSQPISKTDTVRQLVAARRYKDALRIVKTFRLGLTKEQQVTFGRAYESYHYGYLQAQMKRDPEECRRKGIELLKELYGTPRQVALPLTA